MRKHFSRNIHDVKYKYAMIILHLEIFMLRACFPNVSQFPIRETLFLCQFLFPRCKLCLRYTTQSFNENPSMRAVAKNLPAQALASTHLFLLAIWAKAKVCEHFQIWPFDAPFSSTKVFDTKSKMWFWPLVLLEMISFLSFTQTFAMQC